MHTVLGLSSMFFVLLGRSLTYRLLHSVSDWSQRRLIQFFILAMPLVTLGLGLTGLHHFIERRCFTDIPFWDSLIGVFLPLGMAAIALGALCLGAVRLLFMTLHVARKGLSPLDAELQNITDMLARRLNAPHVRVLLCLYDRPLALTSGIFQPTILLSTWMVEHLERHELQAVLAHEVEHVARRDYLIILLATILRDAFFYLPISQMVYHQLQQEKELICDERAVRVTQRPLDLASALTKVWIQAIEGPGFARFGGAQPLVEVGTSIECRIERLLASKNATIHALPSKSAKLRMNMLTLLVSGSVLGANLIIMLVMMGCNPLTLLAKFF